MTMQMAKLAMDSVLMERMPGSPPTPMADAVVPVATLTIPAMAEPIIPHTNGKTYFKLTPKMAGSVTLK